MKTWIEYPNALIRRTLEVWTHVCPKIYQIRSYHIPRDYVYHKYLHYYQGLKRSNTTKSVTYPGWKTLKDKSAF